MCDNILELASMPYTIKCATELHPDPRYEFKQDWLIKVIGGISQWLNSIDVGYRLLAGVVILGIALVIGMLIDDFKIERIVFKRL